MLVQNQQVNFFYKIKYIDKTCNAETYEMKVIKFTTLRECYGFIKSHSKDDKFRLVMPIEVHTYNGDFDSYSFSNDIKPIKMIKDKLLPLSWQVQRSRYLKGEL